MNIKRILCVMLAMVLTMSLMGTLYVSAQIPLSPIIDPVQAADSNMPLYLYATDGDGVCHYMRQTRGTSTSEHGYAEKVGTTSRYSIYTTTNLDDAAVYCLQELSCSGETEYMLQFHDADANKDYVLYILTSGVGPNSTSGTTHAKHHFLWDAENKRFYQMEGDVQYVLVMQYMEATYPKTGALPGMTQYEWRITSAPVGNLQNEGVYPVTLGRFDHTHVYDVPIQIPGGDQHRMDCTCGEEGTQLVSHSFTDGICVCGKREGFSLQDGIYYLTGRVNGQNYYFRQTGTGEKVTYTTPYSVYCDTDKAKATLVDVILETDGGYSLAYPYNNTSARIYVYDVGSNGTVDTGVNTANVQANHHFSWDEENAYFYQMEGDVKYVLALKELKNSNTGTNQIRIQAVPASELSSTVVAVCPEAHTQHSCDTWTVTTPATTTTTGIKTGTCTVCDRQIQEVIPALTPAFYGKSISLQDDFSIHFYVEKAIFADGTYQNPYVIFQLDGVQTTVCAYSQQDDYYVFSFDDIAPDQMGKTVYATLYSEKADGTQCSAATQYSVAEYCYDALALEQTGDTLRRLLVDTLNFGAASQVYRNSDIAAQELVNAALTDEQRSWGSTDVIRELESCRDAGNNDGSVVWYAVSALMGERVQMRVYFCAQEITGLTVKAQSATNQWTLSGDDIKTKDGRYYVDFPYLSPAQMDEEICFTVYQGEEALSSTLHYSIESYASVWLENDEASAELVELVKSVIRYGDSAKAYVDGVYDLQKDVRYLGRTYESGGVQWFNWSASGFTARFQGSGLKATIASNAPNAQNYAYLKVYVDGVEQTDILLDETQQTVVLAQNLDPDEIHTVEVRKRNSPRSSTAGLLHMEVLDGKKLVPPAAKDKLIEFVGDSLTVGYSAADVNKEETAWSTKTEDGTKTYSKQVADAFGAEYMVTAISGRGVVMNNSGGSGYLLPDVYPELDIYNAPGNAYDFALQPDVIVINLGTNDATNSNLDIAKFKTGVANFLQLVRAKNPNAQIIWAYGLRSDKKTAEVDAALNEVISSLGDPNVYYLQLDLAADMHLNHPTAAAYAPAGEKLIEKIEEITGWNSLN